ncbi:cytochrome P450 [Streptomyces sp. 110]|uniref:Cytochrome P450 n=1 Tax=Streptomyces endocoffeicus TaxID=2898945 RepID=A0ABS1PY46_9ACTN|nr:cytochrome P450 [Streptomyces endocoffeicus]MBL1117224.1 cytochrome P450 [Streptomyces endocoffeicus]
MGEAEVADETKPEGAEAEGAESAKPEGAEARCPLGDFPFATEHPLEPPKEWAALRAEGCPIPELALRSTGAPVRVLTRYEDVHAMLSDPRFPRDVSEAGPDGTGTGERHQRWRRLVGQALTAKRVAALRPRIVAIGHALVDAMEAGPIPADLWTGFAYPFPARVVGALLGVPEADWDRFAYWSGALFSGDRYGERETRTAREELLAYLGEQVARTRSAPGDDLLSKLIEITDAADPRPPGAVLVQIAQGLMHAGHETTSSVIGKLVPVLLDDRSRWQRLLDDRSLIRPAVEELLRFDVNRGPGMPRYLTEDAQLGGEVIPKGSTTVSVVASANRDERMFPHADHLDLTRTPNRHLAFGAGAHSCIGQALARTELHVALEILLDRLPDLDLAVPSAELARRTGVLTDSFERVPVVW